MTTKPVPFFEKPQDKPTTYDGLLGWSSDWKCYLDPEEKPVPLDDIESLSPGQESITVKKGDTLGQIAREYHCPVDELADYNNISKMDLIYPGQVINIPQRRYMLSEASGEKSTNECLLSFTFEDLIEKPIAGLKVKITTILGDVYESVTDGIGRIEDVVITADTEISVFVSSGLGKIKEVANFMAQEGKVGVLLSSPKVRVKGKSAALTGPAENIESKKEEVNTISIGRDREGKPRLQVNHMCPNRYDLMLGKNVIYWNQIIRASERSGIIPQSIAAVISAEAAKYPGGVWKPTSVCKDSANSTEDVTVYKSSAAGMTQFLNGTWMTETLKEGTYLFEKATNLGLVADKPVLNKDGQEVKNKSGEVIYEKKFQVSPDTWKNLHELKAERYITGITPYPAHATSEVQTWLNLRFNPEYAIMAAVDYGVANLAALKNDGYNIDGLNDAEKAKIIYLTHHLGLANARRFIKNEITEESACELLKAQVGLKSATIKIKKHGGSVKAHRLWLEKYINDNITIFTFYCPEITTSIKIEDVLTTRIIDKLQKVTK
jgi:LysM domain.